MDNELTDYTGLSISNLYDKGSDDGLEKWAVDKANWYWDNKGGL